MSYTYRTDDVDFIIRDTTTEASVCAAVAASSALLGNTVILEELHVHVDHLSKEYELVGTSVCYTIPAVEAFQLARKLQRSRSLKALTTAKFLEYMPRRDLVVHGVYASRASVKDSYFTGHLLNTKFPGSIKLPVTLNVNSGNKITATVYPAEMRAKLAARLRAYAEKAFNAQGYEVIELTP